MLDQITKTIRTTQDIRVLQEEIGCLRRSLFERMNEGDGFDRALNRQVRATMAQQIREVILAGQISKEQLLDQLEKYLQDLEVVQLHLPLQPSDGFVTVLHNWVLNSLGKNYVIDIVSDRQLIGGVVIVHKGHYFDYSLNNQISKKLPGKVAEAYAAISGTT